MSTLVSPMKLLCCSRSLSCRCRRPPQTDSPEQVLNIIELKQHDVDLDGQISFDEYVSWAYSVHELLVVVTSCWWWLRAGGGG